MDVQYINPFIESIDSVFEMMLDLHPKRNGIKLGAGDGKNSALTSLVGISGAVTGVVVLRFPELTARHVASRMLGSDIHEINAEVVDAVSELVNMVAGSAKAKFAYDPPLELGLPTVVEGREYKIKHPSRSVWLEVPFDSEAGSFTMEVTFGSDGDSRS